MYLKLQDTQQYISNSSFIIAKVAIEEKKKITKYPQKFMQGISMSCGCGKLFKKIKKRFHLSTI